VTAAGGTGGTRTPATLAVAVTLPVPVLSAGGSASPGPVLVVVSFPGVIASGNVVLDELGAALSAILWPDASSRMAWPEAWSVVLLDP
jgi:hypothetical protein